MTSIVYSHKDKQIAIDSRVTNGLRIKSDTEIKWKYVKAELWFFCGSTCDMEKLVNHHLSDCPPKLEYQIDASAMIVADGKAYIASTTEDGEPFRTPLNYNDSLGSGGEFALSALDFGLNVKDAIEYAKTRDSATGGAVHVYDMASARFTGDSDGK